MCATHIKKGQGLGHDHHLVFFLVPIMCGKVALSWLTIVHEQAMQTLLFHTFQGWHVLHIWDKNQNEHQIAKYGNPKLKQN